MSDERPKPRTSPLFDAPTAPHVRRQLGGKDELPPEQTEEAPKSEEIERFDAPAQNTEELLASVAPRCDIDLSEMPTPELERIAPVQVSRRPRPLFWFAAVAALLVAGWWSLRPDSPQAVAPMTTAVTITDEPADETPPAGEPPVVEEVTEAAPTHRADETKPLNTPRPSPRPPVGPSAQTPEEEPPEVPKDGGFLTVVSDQRALVIIDGASLGYTPLNEHPLRRGVHRVRLVVPGGPSAEKEVTVQTDQETIAEFSLYR